MATPTLAEKLDKIKSPGLQSQQRIGSTVVLDSIEATLRDQGATPTPTGYFAALLALLQTVVKDDDVNADRATPIVYLLDVVTPYAPQPLLRSKFTTIFGLLAPVLLLQDVDAILLRSSIGCLESLLIAQDTASWEQSVAQVAPRRAVAGLLNLSLDPRPKVRKRALEALKKVLRNPPPSPSLDHPAAEMCAQTAAKNLQDLAKERKGKKADANDPPLLHALQLAKTVAVASKGWPSKNIESLCELLLGIAKTGNEYMTMAIFDIFEVIFEGMTDEVSSAKLPRLMEIISELRPSANDTQLVPPWLAIISRGYDVSAQVEPDETFQKLPELFAMVSPFLESSSENIRISASECLVSFMANCIPQQVILEPSIYDEKMLEKIAKSASSLLSVQYQAAWLQTFNVLGAMFDTLRWQANPILLSVTKTLGEIREAPAFQHKKEADQVLGKAIRAMGPDVVLSVLPLNIANPQKGQPGRAWMFPILRDFISNTRLEHFKTEMLPLADLLAKKVAAHGAADKTMEVKIYETLVQQVWSTLPGYCDLPLDLAAAFDQSFAERLANVLYEHVELRLDVCRALKTLIESNRVIADIPSGEEEDLILQSRISRQTAKENLTFLGTMAGNMLLVLLNVYTQTLPQSRGPILQTINAFLSITPEAEVIETFDRISTMLSSELQPVEPSEGAGGKGKAPKKDKDMPSTAQTLMDLVITMSMYLPRSSFTTLFNIASIVIVRQDEPQLQKKAYKLIPRLVESDTGKEALQQRSAELQTLILSSTDKVSAPARKDRLVATSALLHFIPDTSLHFIPSVLSEVVICCKENNERAREAAYDLLVQMGHRMIAAAGASINNALVPHMPDDAAPGTANIEEYLTMVSAGLAGSTPHMISASITALSRLLYEFRSELSEHTLSDLVQTMDLFLTSNNREIVKSCLGFVKVCVISLPIALMLPRLSTLVPNLFVWSNEHKGHFKAKVKHIIERMVRRFGYDNIYTHTPDSDKKLLVNIRKTKERAKKQKEAAKAGKDDDDDDEEEDGGRKYENEYDQALYSSDSDDDSDDDDEPAKGKKSKGQKQYILEDDSEPLDLLDKTALAKISSVKPRAARKPTKSKVKMDLDGKLILDGTDADAMDVDEGDVNEEDTGVGAYVAALKGKDVAKRGRGGKIKFSNRRRDDDEEMEMGGDDAQAVKNKISPRGGKFRGRGGDRGGRGRGGPQSGKGGIAAGRRGLGQDKRKGQSVGIGKGRGRGRN